MNLRWTHRRDLPDAQRKTEETRAGTRWDLVAAAALIG
jgi:hypothetical protein